MTLRSRPRTPPRQRALHEGDPLWGPATQRIGSAAAPCSAQRTADGDQTVRRWIDHDLTPAQRQAVRAALTYLRAAEGIGICASEYGRHLGHPPRTRKERRLPLTRSPHTYEKPGKYRTLVKAIDISCNDTSQAFDVRAP